MRNLKNNIISQAGVYVRASFTYDGEQDGSDEANVARQAFNFALNRILGRHTWSTFIENKVLSNSSAVTDNEDIKYSLKFALPEDFYRLLTVSQSIENLGSTGVVSKVWLGEYGEPKPSYWTDYSLRGNTLYTNLSPVAIIYMHNNIERVSYLPANFEASLVYCVASFMARSLDRSSELHREYELLYQRESLLAISNDKLSYKEKNESFDVYGGG